MRGYHGWNFANRYEYARALIIVQFGFRNALMFLSTVYTPLKRILSDAIRGILLVPVT